ncbi:cell wall-binding repeat-containing protein [Dermatophilus congolensis]|uniref:cell wall-binding repeat-containing protein n=1 Tax=Dermatophilus congolensis TaxID=1863 RepID=UPI001AAE3935|nr:cell wall-binding repeat-containing protein [Dermatophilus congolensis]MBO3146339.1 cell wall-binding repeat-containing protein [Dermatophilus congolensis]MBO3148618.1 cell wall-binding repeat-containing protein [Dermatophilus congolensis]MBO3157575.1 cell wall-binding repeat-containing protein [Dermatophilus congolensis]MBO3159855.1 cell wall-binding repeat-containing protein [Dermatophilus congolensis]MBO3166594.1 cell wall-binding repeat-containing protein [Dermatophilus congolensis]
MSYSAARRSIAALAAATLTTGAFATSALAWDDPAGAAIDQAKMGSIGIVDTDRTTNGTQGYTTVKAGVNNQAVGDVRFVFPSTWQAGDTLTFTLGAGAGTPTWSQLPKVNIDSTAYAANTHIHATSGSGAAGSVEDGMQEKYAGTGTPVAPQVTTSFSAGVVTVTFQNSSASNAKDAKFVGAINNAMINTGADVTGDVSVTMASTGGTSVVPTENKTFVATTVVPSRGTVDVVENQIIPDGNSQFIGDMTISGALNGEAPVVTISGGDSNFDTAATVKATAYDASGNALPNALTVDKTATTLTVNGIPASGAARVVITGAMVKTTAAEVTYTLDPDGTAADPSAVSTVLGSGDAALTQTDINRISGGKSFKAIPTVVSVNNRVGGSSRYDTAVSAASNKLNGDTPGVTKGESETVIIAAGEQYADALSAGYLAATQDASLILTQKGMLPEADKEFLHKYGARRVIVIGGEGAVSQNVVNELTAMNATDVVNANFANDSLPDAQATGANRTIKTLDTKIQVTRIGGATRFETNRLVNEYAKRNAPHPIGTRVNEYGAGAKATAIVVNGLSPWDALAAGPLVGDNATATNYPKPIILTSGNTLAKDALTQVKDFGIKHAIVVGGTTAIPASTISNMTTNGVTNTRLGGQSRWETAKAVGDFLMNSNVASGTNTTPGYGFTQANFYVANGGTVNGKVDPNKWADALALGPVAAKLGRVIVLSDSDKLSDPMSKFLTANKAVLETPIPVGGPDVVSDTLIKAAAQLVH